jgi:hypothetical protein
MCASYAAKIELTILIQSLNGLVLFHKSSKALFFIYFKLSVTVVANFEELAAV